MVVSNRLTSAGAPTSRCSASHLHNKRQQGVYLEVHLLALQIFHAAIRAERTMLATCYDTHAVLQPVHAVNFR